MIFFSLHSDFIFVYCAYTGLFASVIASVRVLNFRNFSIRKSLLSKYQKENNFFLLKEKKKAVKKEEIQPLPSSRKSVVYLASESALQHILAGATSTGCHLCDAN